MGVGAAPYGIRLRMPLFGAEVPNQNSSVLRCNANHPIGGSAARELEVKIVRRQRDRHLNPLKS